MSVPYIVDNVSLRVAEAVRKRLAMVGAPCDLYEDRESGRIALVTVLHWRFATDRLIDQCAKQEAEKTNV